MRSGRPWHLHHLGPAPDELEQEPVGDSPERGPGDDAAQHEVARHGECPARLSIGLEPLAEQQRVGGAPDLFLLLREQVGLEPSDQVHETAIRR
jgi:hypothetical protein